MTYPILGAPPRKTDSTWSDSNMFRLYFEVHTKASKYEETKVDSATLRLYKKSYAGKMS